MRRLVVAALLLLSVAVVAVAQNRFNEGGVSGGTGGTGGTSTGTTPITGAAVTVDSALYVREINPPWSSAPVLFNMATGFDMGTSATITEFGTPWTAAGDYYNKGLVIGVNMQTDAAAGVDVFLEVSHTGSGNFNMVIYKNAAGVEDTVSWKFTADTPDTSAGLGLWCAIPVEAQNAVNAAQHWRVSARSPASTGHATYWVSAVGKR